MTLKTDPHEAHGSDGPKNPPQARALQSLADAPPISPRRRRSDQARWRKRLVLLLLLGATGTVVGMYGKALWNQILLITGEKNTDQPLDIQTYTVKRGPLRIAINEQGKLRAVKSHAITFGTNGKITFLAPAGSKVKKGDLVATLDKTEYEQRKTSLLTELETQKAALAVAQQAVPIARSDGTAAVAAAKTRAEEAALGLKQYKAIDVPKKLSDFESQLTEARNKLADAQKKKAETQAQLDEKLLEEGTEKKSIEQQIDLQKQTIASMEKSLTTLENQRKLFRAYNYPQDLKAKQQAVDNSMLEVNKAEIKAAGDALQKEAEVKRAQNSVDRYASEIKQLDENLAKCSAFSPADGLVYYGSEDMMRYGGDIESRIRVGAEWYSNEPIMTIPDISSFQVSVPIAEVYRGRVTPGMTATITVEAVPGLTLKGSLASIASVARSRTSWDSASPQFYDATINLDASDPRMVQGMTVRVEIITAELPAVLHTPIEAVFNEGGQTVVFQWRLAAGKGFAEKWPVLTGQTNDHSVEIRKGLTEADNILLSRPPAFVTPQNYRDLVEAVAPPPEPLPTTVPATSSTNPDTLPATLPATTPSAPQTAPATAPVLMK